MLSGDLNLADLMEFWTSTPFVPEELQISMENRMRFPFAQTCYNCLQLPDLCESYEELESVFKMCLEHKSGYGAI